MFKFILSTLLVTSAWSAAAETIRLEGRDAAKQPCYMDIVEFNWPGGESEWFALTMKVKTNWQLEGNPAIEVKASPSAWVLFGKVHETYDRIAVDLQPGYPITPQSIIKFNFQTWDEKRGLVQEYCRFQ